MTAFDDIQDREAGLARELTSGQLSMIALGGAIGTGLFLGSKFAIGFAGPSVIVSYLIGGAIALMLMAVLAEMTVTHTTSGSFGAYAEHYIHPVAGFLVRYMYWSCIVFAVGTEVTAVGEYMRFWFPAVPGWVWVVFFSGTLIFVNAMHVKAFGTLEYWFSATKVFAILAFIVVAAGVVLAGPGHEEKYGFKNWTADGGFFSGGFTGMWFAVIVSIFSYLSIEMIAVAAAEAKNPAVAVKKAFKATVFRLLVFYILTLSLIVSIAPTRDILAGGSPFVTVMQVVNIPYADAILNFVVIVAALSAMNSQLYISTRMMFSLARGGDAPSVLGRLRANGAPVNALLLSTGGIAVAAIVYTVIPGNAFTFMISLSMFGAMFTWMMIFVTHWFFRRSLRRAGSRPAFRVPGSGVGAVVGAGLMLAIMVTTLFTEAFRMTLVIGVPTLLVVLAGYALSRRGRGLGRPVAGEPDLSDEAPDEAPEAAVRP